MIVDLQLSQQTIQSLKFAYRHKVILNIQVLKYSITNFCLVLEYKHSIIQLLTTVVLYEAGLRKLEASAGGDGMKKIGSRKEDIV